jgi:hypothetical protein
MTFSIEVENDFPKGKRGIIVRHGSQKQDRVVPWNKNGRGNSKPGFDFSSGDDGLGAWD